MCCERYQALEKIVEDALTERVAAEEALTGTTPPFPRREQNFIHAVMVWYEAVLALARHREACAECSG